MPLAPFEVRGGKKPQSSRSMGVRLKTFTRLIRRYLFFTDDSYVIDNKVFFVEVRKGHVYLSFDSNFLT